MFRFAHPEYLLLIVPVALLVGFFIRSQILRIKNTKLWGNPDILDPLMPNVSYVRPQIKFYLQLLVLILLVLVGFLGLLTFDVLRASTPDAGIDIFADYTSVWVWPGYYILGHVFAGKPFRRFMNNPAITKLAKILLFPALMSLYFSELYLVNHQIVYVSLWLLLEHSQLFILCTILFIIFNCTAIKSKAIKKTINFMGPTMVGVYIIHYSVYYILVRVYELFNLGITLHSLVLVFLLSVVISRLLSQNKYTSKIITF